MFLMTQTQNKNIIYNYNTIIQFSWTIITTAWEFMH